MWRLCYSQFTCCSVLWCAPAWLWCSVVRLVVCRRLETHHKAEAMGTAGGARRQVRVAPWRSRVLHRLPAPHAGADPWEESHSCRVLAPPMARPLVESSSPCTFPPSHFFSRDCNRSLSSLGISDEYLFLFLFCFFCFLMSLLLS